MEESLMEPGEKSLDGLRRALVLPDHDITDFSPLQLAYLWKSCTALPPGW